MDRCPLCPNKHKCIEPDGLIDSPYLFLGEAPGWDEERNNRPFVGKTGREVNEHYLPLAGLRRERIRITNAIRCLPDTPQNKLDMGKEKHRELLDSCTQHFLYPMLEEMRPKYIIPMGAFACAAIDSTIELELMHGIPQNTAWGRAFPMFHPAGGLHEPKKMLHIRTDWTRLRRWISGKLLIPQDEYAGMEDYGVIDTRAELDELFESVMITQDQFPWMACDTESKKGGEPFCLSFSLWPGMGRMILATAKDLLKRFQYWVNLWWGKILWHNWIYDSLQVPKMGLSFPHHRIVDTMAKVFHLGNMPQGLKALAFRELGMKMEDFVDVVKPYSMRLCLDYFQQAQEHDWPKPEADVIRGDDMAWKLYKPQSISTKLKRLFTDYKKNPNLDLIERWDNWEQHHRDIQQRCGPFPGMCISHAWEADRPRVIRYACLSYESRVETPTGYLKIGDIVTQRYSGLVRTYNPETFSIENRRVVGWYGLEKSGPWTSIVTEHTPESRWGVGTRYTPDHEILTPNGYRPVSKIQAGDQVYLPVHKLNEVERQVIYGSILGDGDITRRNHTGWAGLRFSHCEAQHAYARWKGSLFSNLNMTEGYKKPRKLIINGRETISSRFLTLSSQFHPELVRLRKDSYLIPGFKNVGGWLRELTPLAVAIWYQDDGCIVRGESARLYTQGFIEDDVDTLRQALLTQFYIESTKFEARPGQWVIGIPKSHSRLFYTLIHPYVHESMQYKLPVEWRGRGLDIPMMPPAGLVPSTVVKVFRNPMHNRGWLDKMSYCIDVEDTHNFVTMGEIAHNCRDTDSDLRLYPLLLKMERVVRKLPQERWRDAA